MKRSESLWLIFFGGVMALILINSAIQISIPARLNQMFTSRFNSVQLPIGDAPETTALQADRRSWPTLPPKYDRASRYETTILANGDRADVYYPIGVRTTEAAITTSPLPIALLLQGFNVNKSFYSQVATQIAKQGFVVIVPNHYTSVRGERELFAQVDQIPAVLDSAQAENQNPASPIKGIVDLQKLVLIGHSHGGFIGMDAIRNACDPPWCEGQYTRPPELVAGVFYGADLWYDGDFISIENDRIPIAFIVGSEDSLIADRAVKATYDRVQTPPKAFVRVIGANHYGITDRNNPAGAPEESNQARLAQATSIEIISRWTAAFLRTYAGSDQVAKHYLENKARGDQTVTVLRQD